MARTWIAFFAAISISSAALGADGITLTHHEPLERLSIQAERADFSSKLLAAAPVNLSFDALGQSFDLELEPNAGLMVRPPPNTTCR